MRAGIQAASAALWIAVLLFVGSGCDDVNDRVGVVDFGTRTDGRVEPPEDAAPRPDGRPMLDQGSDATPADATPRDAAPADAGPPDAAADQGGMDLGADMAPDARPGCGPEDCGPDETCGPDGQCIPRCVVGGCADGSHCNAAWWCEPGGCAVDGDCAPGSFCGPDGDCLVGCRQAPDDCPPGQFCGPDHLCLPGAPCEAGAPCDTGAPGDCAQGTTVCNADGSGACEPARQAGEERCGGGDEDCDGRVDEGFDLGAECAAGQGICRVAGQIRCTPDGDATCAPLADGPAPEAEACNGRDDDCDGTADEDFADVGAECFLGVGGCARPGVVVCTDGGATRCDAVSGAPAEEICDGVDNDCDGSVDEMAGGGILNERCYAGPDGTRGVGACRAGTRFCVDGAWGVCDGEVLPQPETCNNVDDDCNRLVDDDLGGPLLEACYGGPAGTAGVGRCAAGTRQCSFGEWGACEGEVLPGNEICDQADNDCDGEVDDGLPGGCACDPGATRPCYTGPDGTQGVGACAEGTQTCQADGSGWGACQGERGPAAEACDGADNDCDGQTDEAVAGVGEACTLGQGQCARQGVRVCEGQGLRCAAEVVQPVPERCDGLDNDCDGNVDEVFPIDEACQAGVGACARVGVTACDDAGRVVCGAVAGAPGAELCNGLDDDCDGSADESFQVGRACAAGQGLCRADGVWTCDGAGGAVCDADVGQPVDEVCNQRDDDCDGAFDEGLGLGEACQVGVGACQREGARICGANGAAVCSAVAAEPGVEVCNGLDDDCDGQIDNGVEDGGVCVTGQTGVCRTGRRLCVDGGRACVPVAQPSAEVCNGLDDDCDGQVDEDTGRIDCGQGVCARALSACTDGAPTVCDPLRGAQDHELCNGLDDDCDGQVDEDASGDGQPCGNGVGACQRPGVAHCVDGALACDAAPGQPQAEACNGQDDDCDGLTDEEAVDPDEPCFNGVGACRQAGVPACADGAPVCVGQAGAPGVEVCNGADDDCDGQADEGFGGQVCGQGQCRRNLAACDGGEVPACDPFAGAEPERCDGVDNDCDGVVDEDPSDVGGACQSGLGLCRTAGLTVCVQGRVVCGAGAGEPAPETCNGLDDDCDGQADEDAVDAGDACSAGTGACARAGAVRCVGARLVCDAAPGAPGAEVCNAQDDDCDGTTDEGLGTVACGQGACERDLPACVNGAAPACDPLVGAGAEQCNGQDDDCDGAVDEDAAGVGAACRAGQGLCAADGVRVCQDGALLCDAQRGQPALEACDGADNDCDGLTDEGFNLGQACQGGVGECRAVGQVACAADGTATCDAPLGQPVAEQCNGLDDDCDGRLDEGTGGDACDTGQLGVCAAGVDRCQGGVLRCDRQGQPAAEACDGLDNDCDGVVDDGLGTVPCGVGACARDLPACPDGAPAVCDPRQGATPELCNGVDDDCDGATDEAPTDAGGACAVGTGACERSGRTVCQAGGLVCDAAPGAPTQELCNGVDDDCDGQVDDNVAGIEQCTAGVGACARTAFRECVNGAFTCPAQAGAPAAEICNGQDDDCDGELDEGFGSTVCGLGQCRHAVPNCDGGQPEACDPLQGAQAERCDGLDNDCDGSVDEDAPGAGAACAAGVGQCRADGITVCAGGQIACGAVAGQPAAEQCNGLDDDCDGTTDEQAAGVGVGCSVGTGACQAQGQQICDLGRLVCDAVPLPPGQEICDGIDNDCDGQRDEALGTITCGDGICRQVVAACQNGQQTVCDPLLGAQDEQCNGFDDDCDGQIDEGFGTQRCGQGVCARDLPVCQGGLLVQCDPLVGANAEVCNGLDDDCDGVVDDGIAAEPCSDGVGACAAVGVRRCVAGAMTCDAQAGAPVAEACNNRDDDCDGRTDEAPLADVGEACERGIGACRDVQPTRCEAGFEICPAVAGDPSPELCDGLDNDCDNAIDEDGPDCDGNGFGDACDLLFNRAVDCDGNQIPDACDIAEGRAEDCNGNGVPDQCNNDGADCVPDVTPPVVDLFLQGNVVNAGTTIQVVVQVGPDDSGIAERGLTLDGQPVALDGFGQAFVELANPGFHEFVGYAVDGAGNRGEDRGTVRVLDPNDVLPPELTLHSPPNGQVAQGVIAFVITATDENLTQWQLSWGPQGDPGAVLLAQGDQNVVQQQVATLDTAGLAAGRYDIRLSAQDINGRGLLLTGFFTIQDCAPQPEICDNRDNDCDGAADEDFAGLGQACTVGQGACQAEGVLRCLGDFSGTACDAVEGLPQIELCNTLDDDCDGRVDERWPVGQVCTAGVGQCERQGNIRCTANGADATCDAVAAQPVAELCDGLDNDCDTDIDEGILGCGVDTPPTVDIVARPEIVDGPGLPVEINVLADDNVGVVFLQLTIDGVVKPLDAGGQAIHIFDRPGLYTLVAIARDAVDQEDTAELVVRVLDPLDQSNPFVDFYEPRPDQVVDREIAIRGEVLDENPVLWRLTYGAPGNSGANLLAEGDDNIAGELARFSPDLMPNGFVELQLYAEDVNGRASGVVRRFVLQRCQAVAEICDGADNDCDDLVDEGLVGCAGDEEPPVVSLFVPADVVNSGTALDVQVSAVDNIRVDSLTLTLNGALLAPNGAGVARVLLDQPGRAHFVATAIDGAGNMDTAEHTVRVLAPGDVDFPDITLHSPPNGANLDAPTAVVATLQDESPWQWWLYQGTAANPQQTLVATGFDNVDNAVIGVIDPAGLAEGNYVFQIVMEDANGRTRTLTASFVVAACEPAAEVCNLADDDCDGLIDETFPDVGNPCSNGTGACQAAGVVRCRADFAGTVCDAVPGAPQVEACTGDDDDCDGRTDEGFALGVACSDGVGACFRQGQTVCSNDGAAAVCSVQAGGPQPEACNGQDDDCDGATDEDVGAQPCGQGQCARVLDTCVNGQTVQVQCDPLLGAVAELCNGLDDDCDGVIDNDPTDIGEPCAVGVGACARQGTIQCDGIGARCDGVPGDPAAELCDQIDNDCDGQTDEGEVCPDVTPPLVALDLDDATVSIGQPVTITVSVTDDRRLGAVTVTVGGQAVQLDQDGQYVFVPQANGDVLVVVVATDEAGNQTREEATIEVRDRRPVAIVDVQPGFIDEGDNHATRVTLDASPSTGGNLTFAWDLPNATVVGGGVDQPTVEVTWSGAVEPQWFLTVRNAQGQDVTAGVVPLNRAPFARIAGDGVVALGQNHTYDGRASEDPNGDPLNYRWTLVQRPEGSQASLGDAAGDQATLLPDLAGRYRLQLEVDDGRLPAEPAIKDVFATSPDLTPPQVQIGFDPVDPQAGQPVLIQVLGNDPAGIATRRLTVDGQDIPLDANGEATFVPPADGRYAVRAEVTDRAGNLTVEEVALFVAAPAAGAAPTVTISAPAEAAGVRQLMEVRGTVSDPDGDLAWYGVALARRGSGIWTTVFEGQDPVNNGPIAQVDVGALAAGMYELRVQASDLQGRTQTALQVIEILPGQSFGGRRMEFLDATVRVAGIPLQIRRIYDSGDKRPGDFGVAWSVDVGVGEVEESNPPYEGWSFQGNCVFNNRIVPTQSHQVTFYIGDEGYRFTFSPTFNGCGLGYQQVVARFLPMPGTDATLQVINDTNTPLLIGNDLFSDDFLEDWRPGYRMTLPDGRVFDFDRDQGATRIDDGAGSRVDITANGLIHSSGVNLSWQRDAAGRITRITLPDGRSRTYTYDGNGDLRRAADFEARVTHFEYDGDHNLLTVIEPDGAAQQSWEYDATGRLIAIVDALGNRRTLGHDGVARQESVVDRTGGETVFLYDEDGNVLEMVDALGNRWVNGYDAAGNRTSITDPLGNVTRFEYDANGRQTARIDANGGRWETAYDADGRVTETRDPLGNVTLIGYDANGFRDRFEDPTGAVTQWSFTADGRVNSITNAEGAQVQYTFDAQGRMTRVVDAGGFATDIVPGPGGAPQVESFAFESTDGVVQAQIRYDLDPDGFIEGVTDTNGARSFLDRSESGQITGFLAPTGQQIDMDLDGVGRIRRQRDPEGRSIGTDYDGEDRLTALTLPGGQRVQKVYDAGGNLVEVIGPTGGRRVQTYDGASRVASIGNGQDIRVDFGYDPAGNLTTTDNQGAVTRFEYDAASRLSAIVDPMGRRTDLERDAAGRITRRVYADQTEERLAWDGNGRQISQQTARGHIWTFGNAPSGMLETVTDPAGGVARFDYDRNGRYNRITDPLGRVTTYAHRPDGRVKARTLPLGQTDQYSYRADGRMDAWTDPAGGVTTYVFDVAARREITRYPDGAERTQTYDELERPVADETAAGRSIITWLTDDQVGSWRDKDGQLVIQQADGGGLPTAALTDLGGVRWHYDNRQFLSEVRAEGGLTVAYGRDLSGLAESAALPGGGTLAWTHDAAGRADTVAYTDGGGLERFAAARTFTQGLLTRVVEDDGRAVDYTYDNLDRVTREVITAVGGGVEAIEYTYDAMGNITQRTDGGGAHALQYDANDRLLDDGAWQYQYDALGRLSERTQGGVTERFTYDGAGHMVGFERLGGQATAVTYAYEHDGLLRSRTEAGVTTRYLWDRGGAHPRLLEERNGDGELVRRYVWGDQLVGYWDAAEQAWHTVVVDQVGTVRLDEGPGGRQRFEFDAYGRRRSAAAPVGLGFASSWTDAASGLVYMQHRWYSPDMMRFAQPDPKPAVAEDPRTLNRYAYAVGNPVHFSDPTGEFGLPSMSVTVAIVGILATGATMFGIGWLTGANSSTGPKNWLQALFMAFTGKLFDDKTCVIWPTVSVSASAGAFSSITAGFDVFHYNGGGPWDGKNALMLTLGLGFEFSAGAAGPGVGVTIAKPIPGIGWNQQTPGHSEGWGLAAGLSSGAIGNLSASASFGVGLGGATFGLGLNPTYKKGEKQLYGLAIVPNMGYTIGTVTGGNGGLLGGASLHLTMTVYMGRLFGWDPN